jgi:hypothetical protein
VTPLNTSYYENGRTICDGDSGGPLLSGSTIFGVVSGGSTTAQFGYDLYGSVSNHYASLCSAMNTYPHSVCRTGAALQALPCKPIATTSIFPGPAMNIVATLCMTGYMGNPAIAPQCCTAAWDQTCVNKAQQYMTTADWNACLAGP